MNTDRIHVPLTASIWLLLGVAVVGAPTWGAEAGASADARARYQQERAVCLSGQSSQDRATCLREAAAALAEAKRGALGAGAAPLARNARQRCEPLPADDRRACEARMQGQGSTSGSVDGGGIYRELREVEPAPAVPVPAR